MSVARSTANQPAWELFQLSANKAALQRNFGVRSLLAFIGPGWSGGQAVRVSIVLVVEDEALVRLTICEGLASEGYEVLSAATADEAIEILASCNDISTVFTDVEMPGSMDGLKLAAAVRDRWPPINIVVTSGKSRPGETQMPRNTQFIGKPYRTADVVRAFGAFI